MSAEGENTRSTETATVPTETEPTLAEAMQNIFSACDTENDGVVLTSKLIEYISPFMACNRTELMQLQEMLDPRDENALVSKDRFYAVMVDWAGRISAANESDEQFQEAVPRDFYKLDDEDCPFVQSTPRSSFGNRFLRGFKLSGSTNISLFSDNSGAASAALDKTVFEERLKELTHQNRKLSDELTLAKVQLTSNEDYIENLQADLNKVVRRLNSEQQTNEQLQKRVEEVDSTKENCEDVLKQYEQLKKQKDALERENLELKESLDALDDEKAELVQQVEKCNKSRCDLEEKFLELNKEVQLNEEKISDMEDVIVRLKADVNEWQSIGESYKQRSEELLAENQTLEKLLHKFQLQQTTATTNRPSNTRNSHCSPSSGNLSPQTINTPPFVTTTSSPLEKIRQHCIVYNSPNLVDQLHNPLSPLANTPEELTATVKSSTPNQFAPLLDNSIPVEFANVSVLSPTIPSAEGQKTHENLRNNTSEEDYWKVNYTQILDERQSPHNSLHAELSELMNASCANGNKCVYLIRLMEMNNDYSKLQQELVEQKVEIERLHKELCINKSNSESIDSNGSTTYITEVRMRLDQEAGDASSVKTPDLYKKRNQELTFKLKALQEDNDTLAKCNQNFLLDFQKVATLYEELKSEIQALLAENVSLKQIFDKNTTLKDQIDELHQHYLAERTEWNRQREQLEHRIVDVSMEVTLLQEKLERTEMVDASTGCNFYDDDGGGCSRIDKGVLSFSRMQMKVDRLQEKIENLEELVRNEKRTLQLQVSKEVVMKGEISDLKHQLSEAALERNQFELKLIQANTLLQNTEIEMFSLKNELKNLVEKAVELKEMEIDIMDAVRCVYESNVDVVSLLKESSLSHCVNSPLVSVLNAWTDSLHSDSNRLDACLLRLQSEEPTFDIVIKVLTEHVKDLKGMMLFNKQFSETLKNFLQEITARNSIQSVNPPDSPDSLNDKNTVVVQGSCEKTQNGGASSGSTVDEWSLSSDCKEDNAHSLLPNFQDISLSRAFPNLSDALLESLNIHQDSSRDEPSTDKGIEEKYTILMTVLTTDALSIKLRHENQMRHLTAQIERFLADLHRLVGGNCTGHKQIRDVTRDFYRVCALAECCGGLQEEVRVHRCCKLIESYVMVLNRKVKLQQSIIRMVVRLHQQKILICNCHNTAKITQLPKYVKNGVKFIASVFEKIPWYCFVVINKSGRGIWRWFSYGVGILVFLTIFTILGNTVTDMVFISDDSIRRFSYSLKDLFWEELLAPISKKVYCVKECPH